MTLEDFRNELAELRELKNAGGRERRMLIRWLLSDKPCDKSNLLLLPVAVMCAICGFFLHVPRLVEDEVMELLFWLLLAGVCACLIACGMSKKRQFDSLIALSEELDARAARLPEGEFAEIAGMLACAPDSAQEDVQCGCYGCGKMLPPGEGRCAVCGPRYAVYGDANHPLDEARLKRIHDLLLEET